MRSRRNVVLLALVCMLAGASLFAYKVTRLGLPLSPGLQSDIWTVEARVSFRAQSGPVKATLQVPNTPQGFGVLSENFVSRGFGLATSETDINREATWSRRSFPCPAFRRDRR